MVRELVFIVVCLCLVGCGNSQEEQMHQPNSSYLIETEWKFTAQDEEKWIPASVPGVVHMDLLNNGVIENPYYENNELKQRWIEEKNWVYVSSIELTEAQLEYDHLELQFDGLDTYALVYLNGNKLLEADNMFRQWKCDISAFAKVGKNEIKVEFTSPLNRNRKKVEEFPYSLPSGNETVELKVSPFTRKAAYHFGWDWGPRFVTSGIWRDVHLNGWNDYRIDGVYCRTDSIVSDLAWMTVTVDVEASKKDSIELLFNGVRRKYGVEEGITTCEYQFSLTNPSLWWPNGHGEQHLYQLEVELQDHEFTLERVKQSYGVRTVELVNEPDSIGTSFYFNVNGKPIFMKGANYIPQSLFLPAVDSSSYHQLILKAKGANMNMLRVWGGGIYENDYFYRLCDEHGIMVWQDFMFAGSMYPFGDEFNQNVLEEVKDNVARLRNHPSIALWCGNNEIEVAWGNWGWQKQYGYSKEDSAKIWDGYAELFHHQIPKKLNEVMPGANYTTTSPLSNWGTAENFNHSSMHYWGVWHGREPFKNFETNVGRFMVEYGFQSFPAIETLRKVISEDQMNIDSEVMKNRQKSYIGNGMITKHAKKWFGSSNSFEEYVENSQKTQALAMKMAIIQHRINQPHCMGTLFWQLNDCWEGPSWSCIDYTGKEKLSYEEVKKWYAPQIVHIQQKPERTIYVVSDQLEEFVGTLKIKVITTKEEVEKSIDVMIPSGNHVVQIDWNSIAELDGIKLKNATLELELTQKEEVLFEDKIEW